MALFKGVGGDQLFWGWIPACVLVKPTIQFIYVYKEQLGEAVTGLPA